MPAHISSPAPRTGSLPERAGCGVCGEPGTAGNAQGALVADSSAIDPYDFAFDGRRYVVACCPEHMRTLVEEARAAWSAGEQWFGQLCRASLLNAMRDASLDEIRAHARLDDAALRAALEWNSARKAAALTLPGGQILPMRPVPASGC
ncbi:hypothetical protein F9C11_24040 [Amycolatopsis sp. VS8301801F10]|uniref:hypothetical protein n=1 Tax=Amycolatopsis sp. VS8301801F10 TaxID=2652442 RepID=UPI0038FD3C3D